MGDIPRFRNIIQLVLNNPGELDRNTLAQQLEVGETSLEQDYLLVLQETGKGFQELNELSDPELLELLAGAKIKTIEKEYSEYVKKIKISPTPMGAKNADMSVPRTGICRIYNEKASRDRRLDIVGITLYPRGFNCDHKGIEQSSVEF